MYTHTPNGETKQGVMQQQRFQLQMEFAIIIQPEGNLS